MKTLKLNSTFKKILAVALIIGLIAIMIFALTACNKGPTVKLVFGKELLKLNAQIDILTQMNNGSADIGVMDSVMAKYYMSTGSYAESMQMIDGLILADERYGIGAKKGNAALVSKINEALIALSADGAVETIADKYGLTSELVIASDTEDPLASSTDPSWNNVVSSGKLIIGYTVFAPIAYKDDNGTLIGFDIELAKKVVEYLNDTYNTSIELETLEINWNNKETMLGNGSIDLVWNGMTINQERIDAMEISIPYMRNQQVAIIRKADAGKYNDFGKFVINVKDAIIAVESGSAAQDVMEYTV